MGNAEYMGTLHCCSSLNLHCLTVSMGPGQHNCLTLIRLHRCTTDRTVQYSTILCSTVQNIIVLCSTEPYCAVEYSTVQYSTVLYSTVLYRTVKYSTHSFCFLSNH